MAAVVSTPVVAWVQAGYFTFQTVSVSSSLTATVQCTGAWELQLPIQFSHNGSISADPIVNVFASMDGITFDSNPFLQFNLTRNPAAAGGSRQSSIRLTTGVYCIQLLNSGPNTASFAIPTALVVTAVGNL